MALLTDVTDRYAEAAGCDALYEVRDARVGLHAFVALHDLSRGPGYGGVRRRVYASSREAVHEVVGLAEGMTLKTAFAGLPAGGAKSVILDDGSGRDPGPIYLALGQAIEELDGSFFAGPDVGTSESELVALRQTTRWVSTVAANPSGSTAAGVVAGCRAALEHLGLGGPIRAAVVGVGSVGREVARGLAGLGLSLVVSDIDPLKAQSIADELGATIADPHALPPCDLLVPCALGPVVTEANVAAFGCQIICGSANHQLDTTTLAHDLDAAGILYVPDFAVNAGAVIEGVMRRQATADADLGRELRRALDDIGPRARRMLALAVEHEITPLEAALMMIGE